MILLVQDARNNVVVFLFVVVYSIPLACGHEAHHQGPSDLYSHPRLKEYCRWDKWEEELIKAICGTLGECQHHNIVAVE